MKVAIIGGGASGLGTAYFLSLAGGIHTTIYEKADYFGGNVFTAYTGASNFGRPFGDLGVNDFNMATYRVFDLVLKGLADKGYPVGSERLCDTTLFFTGKGQTPELVYTMDELKDPPSELLKKISQDWSTFSKNLPIYLKDSKYRSMTVDEFADIRNPNGTYIFSRDFRDYNLKPRINGMYYTNGKDPGSMSIYAVMMYYHLQENIASDAKNTRYYFSQGASSWIHALTRYLEATGCQLNRNTPVKVARTGGKWRVTQANGTYNDYDKVVSAIPADQLDAVFGADLPDLVREIAGRVTYLDSTSYFHTDESVLWVPKDKWSTYNISIQDPAKKTDRPYVITYVSQMHQGNCDGAVPPFVSLDPKGLDQGKILQMFETPSSRDRVPAKKTLRHNTLYPVNMHDQQQLDLLQGNDDLFITCGWTVGAGLHEEVLSHALYIAFTIHSERKVELLPIFHDDHPDHVPGPILAYDPDYEFTNPFE